MKRPYVLCAIFLLALLSSPAFCSETQNAAADFLVEVGERALAEGKTEEAVHEFSKALMLDAQHKQAMEHLKKLGFEYYSILGTFKKLLPGDLQEHLLGPMVDLYCLRNWEFNSGFLFSLTPNSNHYIFKLVLGRRFSKNQSS